jgi:hypothetical protein
VEAYVIESADKPADALNTTEAASLCSGAAARMRILRRRRREGMRCVRVQIGPADIDRLVATGYLGPIERGDHKAIEVATIWFLSDALTCGIRDV